MDPTRSAGTPRCARAALTHLTIRPSMSLAVLALAGAGWAAGPTAKPRKATRAATSRMLAWAERGDRVDMARIVTTTSSFGNPNDRPLRTYGVASEQQLPLGASAVPGDGSLVDVADLGSELRRFEHLDVVTPGQDPEADLDDPAHGGAPQETTVGCAFCPLQWVPNRFSDAVSHARGELQKDVNGRLVRDDVPAATQVALERRLLGRLERSRGDPHVTDPLDLE